MTSANDKQSAARAPILLLVLGAAALGCACWMLSRMGGDPHAKASVELGAPAAGAPGAEFTVGALAEARGRVQGPKVPAEAATEPGTDRVQNPAGESALRERYLALEAAAPGELAARAREWLSGERSSAEKVAWLLALQQSDPEAALPWLEYACSLDIPAGTQGEGPAGFALGILTKDAGRDDAARAAIGRVAFDADSVDVALRRRAASTFAGLCNPLEFAEFGCRLSREGDEALKAGVVVALEARTDSEGQNAAGRLLAWLRPASAVFLARSKDGSH